MTQTPAVHSQPQRTRPLFARLAPAILALGIFASGTSAFAGTPAQNAINAKLAAFRTDFNTDPDPDATTAKAMSIITAKSTDLLLAIAAAAEDPANNAIAAGDFAAAILLAGEGANGVVDAGKFRADKDKVIASVIDQLVKSRALAGDSATIAAIVNSAFTNAKTVANPTGTGLTSSGQAAALGQALKSATNPATGDAIGDQAAVQTVFNAFTKAADAQKLAATAILNANTGTGGNSGAVASFVDSVLDNTALLKIGEYF